MTGWLDIHRGEEPLIVSFPHGGTDIPAPIEAGLASLWLARKDTDWWIDRLYDFARELGATTIRTRISRTVIDVNRDPSGASLYPGQATTALCPTDSFDGEPLYRPGSVPGAAEIERRMAIWFAPYHAAIEAQIERLKARHGRVVLYDAHAIRSRIPRLFEGELPHFNLGTNNGTTCAPAFASAIEDICSRSAFTTVTNGRFRGGWTTRRYGDPGHGVHAFQMEIACRAYMAEPNPLDERNWPAAYDRERAAACRAVLEQVLAAALSFAHSSKSENAHEPHRQ